MKINITKKAQKKLLFSTTKQIKYLIKLDNKIYGN